VIPTLNPFAERPRVTRWGEEAEMREVEADEILSGPAPTTWQDLSNRASALYLTGLTDEALAVAFQAHAENRCVPTLVNLAVILETLGVFEAALLYIRDACTIDPADDRAHAMYGESLLRLGRFAEGWPLYATQRAAHGWIRPYVREWEGPHQALSGKRLLVIEGGGYGDNIYFLRWLDTLRRWGARIDYICQPSFAPLVRRLGYRAIENWAGNIDLKFRDYDYFTSLLALGWKLGVTLENYRWSGPYIKEKRPWWRGSVLRARPRIGICWRAGEGRSPRKQRSLNNLQLRHVVEALPLRCRWVNLTHDHPHPDMPNPDLSTWLDTARAVADLDLLVSVDTGVAHLGGAMDVPTWTVLPGAAAWQYPVGYDTHPLYPSMRVFRNQGEGIDDAVTSLILALKALG